MCSIKDLEELIFLLAERPGEMVHCSQVRNMFASRACRKSVMIGDPLNKRQMKQVSILVCSSAIIIMILTGLSVQ